MDNKELLLALRKSFSTAVLQSYEQRKTYLEKLLVAIEANEDALFDGLYRDLKKSKEEARLTETGFVMQDLKLAIKHLNKWMRPIKVGNNLINFPGKSRIHSEPLGVVLIISPWNYPFNLLFTPLVAAIAAGNTVALKPSEFAPATAAAMKKIIEEVFPTNIVAYVEGNGADVIPAMMDAFRFDHVFYTGSTAVGRKIYEAAAKKLSPVTLELGGKSPCVVDEDANMEVAAKRIVFSKFINAGQTCVAPDYLLVHHSKEEEFIALLKKYMFQFYTDPKEEGYDFGKIINKSQFDRLKKYVEDGEVIEGGVIDEPNMQIAPTLLGNISISDDVMQEEIFGPILPIMSFTNKQEALQIIAANENPLAFYVFTGSDSNAEDWLQAVPSGGACVNNCILHLSNHRLPFGGRGNSGIGAYHGKYGFDTFSHKKSVMHSATWFDPSVKYPPYKGKLDLLKKITG